MPTTSGQGAGRPAPPVGAKRCGELPGACCCVPNSNCSQLRCTGRMRDCDRCRARAIPCVPLASQQLRGGNGFPMSPASHESLQSRRRVIQPNESAQAVLEVDNAPDSALPQGRATSEVRNDDVSKDTTLAEMFLSFGTFLSFSYNTEFMLISSMIKRSSGATQRISSQPIHPGSVGTVFIWTMTLRTLLTCQIPAWFRLTCSLRRLGTYCVLYTRLLCSPGRLGRSWTLLLGLTPSRQDQPAIATAARFLRVSHPHNAPASKTPFVLYNGSTTTISV